MLTFESWCSEVLAVQAIFSLPDRANLVYVLALSGLAHLASVLVERDPFHREEVLQQYRECFQMAEKVLGATWVESHALIFAAHGMLPP